MQIAIKLDDKLSRKLKALTNEKNSQEKIIKEALEEKITKITKFENDPFTKWVLNKKTNIKDKNDVSINHDKYLYGDKI